MAGRPGGDADALRAQLRDDVGAGVAHQRHGQDVGRCARAHRHYAAHGQQLFPAIVPQGGHVGELRVVIFQAQLYRLGKAGDLGGGLRAGAQAALLSAAGQQGTGLAQARADIQRADTLGRAQLVAGQAHHVHAPARRVAGDFQKPLHRVTVQQGRGLFLPQQAGRLRYGEHAARLVVHQHHGHQHRVLTQGIGHLLHGDIAVTPGLEVRHVIALLRQELAGLEDGAVLHGGGDDVLAGVAALPQSGLDGPVVALRAAGGEVQVLRGAVQRSGDDGAPALHRFFHLLTGGVLGGGVAAVVQQHVIYRVGHRLRHGCGGRIVQIDHICLLFS